MNSAQQLDQTYTTSIINFNNVTVLLERSVGMTYGLQRPNKQIFFKPSNLSRVCFVSVGCVCVSARQGGHTLSCVCAFSLCA